MTPAMTIGPRTGGSVVRRQPHELLCAALLCVLLVLTGCGGGSDQVLTAADETVVGAVGSGDNTDAPNPPAPLPEAPALQPPAAPVLSVSPQAIKTLRFNWGTVEGATHYQLLQDPTGTSGYTAVATLDAADTDMDLAVFLPERVNARYLLEACNAAGCSASAMQSVAGTLDAAVGYVKAGVVGAADEFGAAVALSGDGLTLAVGALREDGTGQGVNADPTQLGAANSGAVYVFVRGADGWVQQAYLKASNADPGDSFGHSVALSHDGQTLAVGAPGEASSSTQINAGQSNNSQSAQGAAYVFTRNQATWQQQAYVKPASNSGNSGLFGNLFGAGFGSAVALSADGDRLAVAAPNENSNATGVDGNGNNSNAGISGAVFVFARSAGQWQQSSYIKASNTHNGARFGRAIALSADGTTLAVGSDSEKGTSAGINGDDSQLGLQSVGAAYVFVDGPTGWAQEAYIKASQPTVSSGFGRQLALSGNGTVLAVGSPADRSAAQGVMADGPHDDSGSTSGAVYMFTRGAQGWAQQAYIKAAVFQTAGQFGGALALNADGTRMVVGAPVEYGQDQGLYANPADQSPTVAHFGAAYLLDLGPSGWAQTHYFKNSHFGRHTRFGEALALSAQGDVLAVGAKREASATAADPTDASAPDSGAVYLY